MLNSHRPGGENSYYQSPCDNFDYYMRIQYSHMCIQYACTVRFSKRFYLKEGTFKTYNFNRSLIKLSKTNIQNYFGNRKWAKLTLKIVNSDQLL